MKKLILIFSFWFLPALPAQALMEIEGFLWLMKPAGEASVGIDGLEGTKADLEDDLGYDDIENVPGIRAFLGKTHQVGFSAFKLDASANTTINRTIRFQDKEFQINENVSTAFDLTVIQGLYRFDIGPDIFHGGIMAGGEYINIGAEAASPRLGRAAADVDTGMFVIGVFAETNPLPFLQGRISLLGGTFDIGDIEAAYLDFELAVMAKFPPGFHVGAGYRHIAVDAKDSNLPLEIDLAFSGPTIVVGFEW
ncbi:MAG: hypothetical protein AB1659_12180 [Thermodesulfobacteriota bacterium]